MNYYEILLPLALILLLSKFMSILFKKLGLPQVVGMLLAGILLGLIKLSRDKRYSTPPQWKAFLSLQKSA